MDDGHAESDPLERLEEVFDAIWEEVSAKDKLERLMLAQGLISALIEREINCSAYWSQSLLVDTNDEGDIMAMVAVRTTHEFVDKDAVRHAVKALVQELDEAEVVD